MSIQFVQEQKTGIGSIFQEGCVKYRANVRCSPQAYLLIIGDPFPSSANDNSKEHQDMADWIEPPAKAPSFSLKSTHGTTVKLSDFKGKPVVLYFYPKDNTPGCTRQACAFRDRIAEIQKLGAVVLGVSPDDVASHKKFSEKFALNFPLLADTDHALAEKYGAWREKNMYGKVSMGIQRSTFLIDAAGVVAKVWKKVSVDGHDQQVIDALKALS